MKCEWQKNSLSENFFELARNYVKRKSIKTAYAFCLSFIILSLFIPVSNAVSINIDAPSYIIQGDSTSVNFSIYSSIGFNGSVYLSYLNVNSSITAVNFTNSSFTGEFYNFSSSIKGILAGDFSIYANLTNYSGITLATLNKTGAVNSSMPKIISSSPSGIVSKDSTILIIKTNEVATCKYDSANANYENLTNTFSNTLSTNHNQSLNGLSQGEHNYYVRCQDANGYTMNESAIIKFTVDLPPSAQISLSYSSPVKAGTIEVTVITSENLENAPNLEYSFNDANARKQISLTGSNSNWKGYLIITELDDNKIGTFYFTATDNVGNIGTKITSGNIFVVDTKKPDAPQSTKALSEPDGSVKVSWYYSGEEADYFNIYRSTASGINYVDFYAKSNGSTQFIDRATIDKVTYYYKISTVDKAGNEGSLSEEIFATSLNKEVTNSSSASSKSEESTVPKLLPPNLVPRVDIFIKKIDKLLIDITDAVKQLDEKPQEKKGLIAEFNIVEQVNAAKSKAEGLKQQLESFKLDYAAQDELEQKLSAVDLEAKKIEKITPKDIDILEKSDFSLGMGKEDFQNAVNELFKDGSFNEQEKSNYIDKNFREKDKIKIDVSVKVVVIFFLDGTKSEKSMVKKSLSYQGARNLSDVIVVETIPKSIAQNVNEIEFLNQKYEVVKEDPIVKFGFLKFNSNGEHISYNLNKRINLDEIKNAKTVVLLSPNEIIKILNQATGFSIFSLKNLGLSRTQMIFVWLGILIIIGLLAYYLLFVKDYKYAFKKLGRLIKLRKLEGSVRKESQYAPDLPELSGKAVMYSNDFRNNAQFSEQDAKKILTELSLNIKDVKSDLADKLLPVFVMLNNKISSIENNDITFISTLIEQAHRHIDNDSHSEAVRLYPKINSIYQNLPKEKRLQVYDKCTELYRRIKR